MNKNLDFIFTKIKLGFKENLEYKANLWSGILLNIIVIISILLFYKIFSGLSSEFLKWEYYDFALCFIIILAGSKSPIICSMRHLNKSLLMGNLNTILTKPINSFLFQSLMYLRGAALAIFSILIFTLYLMIFINDYKNIFYFTLFFIFSFFYIKFYYDIFQVTAFFMKYNFFLNNIAFEVNTTIQNFTPKAFEKISTILIYLLPNSLFGYLSIELLKGNTKQLIFLLPYIFASFLFLVSATLFMWKIGLKKYEAFG